MSDEDVPCIGICQTDEFGYCIGCGRRGESFPDPATTASAPSPAAAPAHTEAGLPFSPQRRRDAEKS